ncbi:MULTISPECIES: Imm27 family immunity protein [unclassified Alteromonas]|uniref:Imm27 family immunity protein n=1 Tax=unclassified Alteromonas TaxID=2614992 RepID=UPI000509D130|nr:MULTISPECIES: Imm27 family immunity protein [unclassified Alteromonas]
MDIISSQLELETFISTKCIKIAVSESGWDTLYLEKANSSFWIKSYPNSSMHGGGKPILSKIDQALAKERFDV